MSTATLLNTSLAPHLSRGKATMSISSLLTDDGAAPHVTDNTTVPAPSSAQVKEAAPPKEEELDSPDEDMSDIAKSASTGDVEDVPDCDREFICKHDETSRCLTGQYSMPLARKVISDHFGRNKACTRKITNWPLYCRKHYQRATYNKKLWQFRKLELIFRQFDIIEQQFPGTTYEVELKKSEMDRVHRYSRKLREGCSSEDASNFIAPVPGKQFEMPVNILLELDNGAKEVRNIDEVKAMVQRIVELVEDGKLEQVPSIEFLPILPSDTESPNKKARKAPTPKKARGSKGPSSQTSPSRVSAKGSVKKPGQ